MNLEKLNKKREKRRLKMIKRFGSEKLKLWENEDLVDMDKLLAKIQDNYVMGAGSCWWSIKIGRAHV